MTFRALITLAEGIDDLQSVTLIDVLRRAGIEVVVASIESRRMLTCARGTRLTADTMLVDVLAQHFDLIVLPGGVVGVQHLAAHQPLLQLVTDQAAAGRLFAGIAEAPAQALQQPAISCPAVTSSTNRSSSTAIASPPKAPARRCRLR